MNAKNISKLSQSNEEYIQCYILDKKPSKFSNFLKKNTQLSEEQHNLFVNFLKSTENKYPEQLVTIEANNFSPLDLQFLIEKLNKQNPKISVKLQLPENLDQCSYLIKTNTNQTETKNMTQQEYDKATKLINKYNSKIEEQIKKITSNKPKT